MSLQLVGNAQNNHISDVKKSKNFNRISIQQNKSIEQLLND